MLRAPTHDELTRPRLTARFHAAARDRVVLVVAPAGYGKSIALRQYLEECGEPAIRFNVRTEHATLLGFVRGFAEAFLPAAPALAQTLVQTYSAVQSSETPGADLAEWAQQHVGAYEGIVAVDDLHLAQDEPQIVEFVKHLVRHCASIRWLLCTRSSAKLPLGEWAIAGYMTVPVDEHDLRFTAEEAVEVSRVLGAGADDDAVDELVKLTRGWPTALAFALRSAVHAGDVRKLAAATRDVMYRYLSEHIYDSLTERQRELLRFIAFAPTIDLEVLGFCGFPDARRLLEDLRTRVTFISVDSSGMYRCHDLFVEFVQQHVALDGAEAALRIRCEIGRASERADNVPEALRQYAAAHAEQDILRLLTSHGLSFFETGYSDVVEDAICALPHQARAENAIALALRGMRNATCGRFDRAEDLLRRSLAYSNDPRALVAIGIRLAVVMLNNGCDPRPLLMQIEPAARDNVSRAELLSLLSTAHGRFDDRENAHKYISETESLLSTIDEGSALAKIYLRLAIAASDAEMPYERVSALALSAERLALKSGLGTIAGNAYALLGNLAIHYFEDLSVLDDLATKIRACASEDRLLQRQILLWQAERLYYSGDDNAANLILEELNRCKTSDLVRTSLELPLRAMVFAWHGRFDDARRAMAKFVTEWCVPFAWDRALSAAVFALFCAVTGYAQQARDAIEIARAAVTNTFTLLYRMRQNERATMFCAIAEVLLGRTSAAERLLHRTNPSDPRGAALHQLALALCHKVRGQDVDIARALDLFNDADYCGYGKMLRAVLRRHGFLDPGCSPRLLTKAEIAVLAALATGQSPKEIAAQTGRSVHTVRTLAQHAAEKLGCRGRQQTIAVARTRGLIA